MEILSDATFRGTTTFKKDVSIDGGNFSVTRSGESEPIIQTNKEPEEYDLYVKGTEYVGGIRVAKEANIGWAYIYGRTSTHGAIIYDDLELYGFNTITANSKSITFPSKAGTLALTSDIPSVPSVAGFLKYKKVPINFNVPADCTVFTTAMDTGVQSDKVVSLNLFKGESITFGSTTCWATKQVPADVWAIAGGQYFVVEKSSAFAISSTDGYEIRAAYYE